MALSRSFSPLRHAAFRQIWIAILVSNFGSVIQSVGAAWMMTTLTPSKQMVALVQASATLPLMMFSLIAGAIADALDKRQTMLAAQALMLLASSALALLTLFGRITPWGLLALTLVVGTGTALNTPAWQASLRMQVPMADLPAAVALNSLSFNTARSIGPALGGSLLVIAGPAANFVINAVSYMGTIFVLLRWRPQRDGGRPAAREGFWRSIWRGVCIAIGQPAIRRPLCRITLFSIFTASLWSTMPLVARDLLHGDARTFGIVVGAFGVGSILGALIVTELRQFLGPDGLFGIASLGFAAAMIGVAYQNQLALDLPFLVLAGLSWVSGMSTISVTIQMYAPQDAIGRCHSLYQMCAFGGLSAGSYVWGSVADRIGTGTAILVAGYCLLATPLLALLQPLPALPDNLDPG